MSKKNTKIVLSILCLSSYLFMAVGSEESKDDKGNKNNVDQEINNKETIKQKDSVENIDEPTYSNDDIEENNDTILMNNTYENDLME